LREEAAKRQESISKLPGESPVFQAAARDSQAWLLKRAEEFETEARWKKALLREQRRKA